MTKKEETSSISPEIKTTGGKDIVKPREIKAGIYWVGTVDWDRRLFDALIPLPDGTNAWVSGKVVHCHADKERHYWIGISFLVGNKS